jgi:hypothetical protein
MRLVSYRHDENDGEPPLFLADGGRGRGRDRGDRDTS